QHHAELLSALAAVAANAVENAHAYAAEQRARHEAERLQELAQRLGQSLVAEDILAQIVETAAELLEADVAGVFLLDAKGDSFELAAGRGLRPGTRFPRDRSLGGRVIVSGEAIVLPDAANAPTVALPQLVSGKAVGSLVVAPVISTSGPLGVVEVYSTAVGAFDVHSANLLAGLAGAAAAVLENSRLYKQEEELRRQKDQFLAAA